MKASVPHDPATDPACVFAKDLGVPEAFLYDLLDADDWSFIVKSHAFLESAVTHLLTTHFNQPALGQILGRLELSDTRYGKALIAQALGLLDSDALTFIRALSELRNRLVHDVRSVAFSFQEYVATLDHNQFRSFANNQKLIRQFAPPTSKLATDPETLLTFARKEPKLLLWFNLLLLSSLLHTVAGRSRTRAQIEDMAKGLIEHVVKTKLAEARASSDAT